MMKGSGSQCMPFSSLNLASSDFMYSIALRQLSGVTSFIYSIRRTSTSFMYYVVFLAPTPFFTSAQINSIGFSSQ